MITIKDLGGRKFLFCVILIILTFILIIFARIEQSEFTKLALATLAVFTGTNLYAKNQKKRDEIVNISSTQIEDKK
jgi:hypothetical protein